MVSRHVYTMMGTYRMLTCQRAKMLLNRQNHYRNQKDRARMVLAGIDALNFQKIYGLHGTISPQAIFIPASPEGWV